MSQDVRKAEIRQRLEEVRSRTLRLLSFVPEPFLKVRVHDFYSPVGWHFGHLGMTEEYWACTCARGVAPLDEDLTFLFANLPENPKDNRVHLPARDEILAYLHTTRCAALAALENADIASDNPLLTDGYAWEFAAQHECQHQETICELLQLINRDCGEPSGEAVVLSPLPQGEMVQVAGGRFTMGSNWRHGYDNEMLEHDVEVASFEMDRAPVTAGQWTSFMEDGGYARSELWSEAGWAWREREGAVRPEYWREDGWYCGPMGLRPLDSNEPISCVSWYEADAYARWAGKRLPTEAEWEFAARFDPATGRTRWYPWGNEEPNADRASFGMNAWQPDPVGSHPSGASATGLLDMAGGVWEWTSSPFLPYPGFEAFPYDGYSKDHMDGNHFVCRGGSWASAATILRGSFRNWYVPTYRQGFLGLRCAR